MNEGNSHTHGENIPEVVWERQWTKGGSKTHRMINVIMSVEKNDRGSGWGQLGGCNTKRGRLGRPWEGTIWARAWRAPRHLRGGSENWGGKGDTCTVCLAPWPEEVRGSLSQNSCTSPLLSFRPAGTRGRWAGLWPHCCHPWLWPLLVLSLVLLRLQPHLSKLIPHRECFWHCSSLTPTTLGHTRLRMWSCASVCPLD